MRYPSAIALLLMASSQAMAGDDPRKVIESEENAPNSGRYERKVFDA